MKRRIRETLYCSSYSFFFLWDLFNATHNVVRSGEKQANVIQWNYPDRGSYFEQCNLLISYIDTIKEEVEKQIYKKLKAAK